jgi:hypothetical protein
MRSQLQRLSQTMGVSTPIEQAKGMELDILNNNIAPGTADIAAVFKDFVASVTGCAPEYFFGGGSAAYSQAAFQIHTTNENLRAQYQIGMIEPLLRFMVNSLIRYDKEFQTFGVGEDDFDVEFESIYDETEQEAADLKTKKIEAIIKMAQYPELETVFKQEGLLSDDIVLPEIEEPEPPFNGEEDSGADDNHADSKLTRPLA